MPLPHKLEKPLNELWNQTVVPIHDSLVELGAEPGTPFDDRQFTALKMNYLEQTERFLNHLLTSLESADYKTYERELNDYFMQTTLVIHEDLFKFEQMALKRTLEQYVTPVNEQTEPMLMISQASFFANTDSQQFVVIEDDELELGSTVTSTFLS